MSRELDSNQGRWSCCFFSALQSGMLWEVGHFESEEQMPQLSELQRNAHSKSTHRLSNNFANGFTHGEETFVVDERSRASMASMVEEKLSRLQQEALRFLGGLRSSRS
jgi:hypothetical protein